MSKRRSVVLPLEEAVSLIKDGDTLGIGGFVTTSKPMALLRGIMRAGKKDLKLVAATASIDVDMMISLGLVREVMTSYVGAEAIASILPFYSRQSGHTFQAKDIDQGTFITMLRAAILLLPFLPSWGPVGTSMPDINPDMKWVQDPFTGINLVAVPPLAPDVTILQAAQADKHGNVQHLGAVYVDPLLAQAAKKVIVQVERLVSNEEIRKHPEFTTLAGKFVDAIVVAPFGAHPTASPSYSLDRDNIKEYVVAAKAYFEGNTGLLASYLDKYIKKPVNNIEYLETVGMKKFLSLSREEGS